MIITNIWKNKKCSKPPTSNVLVLNVGNGWVAGGSWDDDITSDDWDHSQKFPAFSTSKLNTMLIGTLAVMTSKKIKQMQLCDEFLLAMNGVIA
jgi:hypothetical protein